MSSRAISNKRKANGYLNTVHRFVNPIIVLGLLTTVIIFGLETLVGAVGLRAIYRGLGTAVGLMSLVLIPFAIRYERMTSVEQRRYLIITVIIGLIAATPISIPLVVVGWFTGVGTGALFIPVEIMIAVFTGVLTLIILFTLHEHKLVARVLTVIALLYSAGYFIGMGAKIAYSEAEIPRRLVHNGKQYFLYLHWGWLGDPDTLLLYECNAIGTNCELTYRAPSGYYRERDLSLVVDQQTDAVEVSVDGQLSPHDLTEDDVRYLCTFFRASSNDPFCREPRFQDRYTFISMVQRTLGEINYATVRPLFKSAQTEDGTDCLPPEEAFLKTKDKDITCKLRFSDDKPYYVTLYMTNDYDPVWYRLSLIIPGGKND